MDKRKRIKELVEILNKAAKSYYVDAVEIMPNIEYDKLYDELVSLEKETNVVLSNSPTQNVGYETASELPKKAHESPMLSLDKTKSVAELEDWLGDNKALLSWKMDGLTIVLTYRGGELVEAVTRGNGIIGEVITNNAKNFQNVPLRIEYKGELILRGEAVIKYSDFKRINDSITDADARYKNPRNLCSGSVRQLNPAVTRERKVYFNVFNVVRADNIDFENSKAKQFEWAKNEGFDVVEYKFTQRASLADDIAKFESKIAENDIPSDGLVLLLDDIALGERLGSTSKFPRNAMAFKWSDERQTTKLKYIEWSPSRTGLINPVAVFEPVELEGTTVSRASLHNVSIFEELMLGVGDEISVYKANMIIPQVYENLTKSNTEKIPKICPACGRDTTIKKDNESKVLLCTNPDCQIKHIKQYALMASRDALNIDGLSESTLEKFLSKGFIKSDSDLFRLDKFKDEIINMEGFGKRSYEKLIAALDEAKNTTVSRFLYSLGIAGIGSANAKMIAKYFDNDIDRIISASKDDLRDIEGIGEVLAGSIEDFFKSEKNIENVESLRKILKFETEESGGGDKFAGKVFVITGSLTHFSNRNEMKELIEKNGGKVSGSVSSKTNFLINNDTGSNSSKNKKAKELGVEIISEEDFLKLLE
ncbi:DNA ligase (NAD+) [Lachnoanaerobaculum saburreum F0468]|uniref:DNA ligase n=2 Tax=Lachnoanaerobaculum saburreum TaxID=467210 RepID=I0R8Q7_9FIRM|nr:NAD-dependent DNA ligase LigA [Lachnoanaerobaculum saburreum]EFU75654.1 DNA ligase (NAD+) [Lachnoanaerobaculum saburreum DSM 3986]EIC96065.1 DNA ligase (NAD+) [Lachnoanaerobaculum saburreum F0468]RKW49670.1 MAG: NAD-dependent DNA ligase LigA [Lachnospiraceae bacterium]